MTVSLPIDDSFDRLAENVRRLATDDAEYQRLLTEITVIEFVKRLTEDFKNEAELRRKGGYSSLALERKKKEACLVDFLDGGHHIQKGKRSKRKPAAKVPDSVLQFIRSSDERDESDKTQKVSVSVKLLSEQASERASEEEGEDSCFIDSINGDRRNQNGKRLMRKSAPKVLALPKRRKIMAQALRVNAQAPEPTVPEDFKTEIERMNGIGVVFIIEKSLMETDIIKQNNRLSIPEKQIRNEFLSDEEKRLLDDKKGLDVTVIQPCRTPITLVLKKWFMSNSFTYNLIGGWRKNVVENKANALETGSVIRLWAFRQNSNLCFSLVKVKDEED